MCAIIEKVCGGGRKRGGQDICFAVDYNREFSVLKETTNILC